MKPFDYAVAGDLDGALLALGEGYKPKAGGIDLLDRLKERTEESGKLVSLLGVKDMRGIREEGGALVVGALATLREIASSPLVQQWCAALATAAGEAATPQIRAVATLGGNLCQRPRCWYFRLKEFECLKKGGATCFAVEGENRYHALFGEGPCHIVHPSNTAVPLVAADAEIEVRSPAGARTIRAREFFAPPAKSMYSENVLGPEDLVAAVRLRRRIAKSAYVEFREKQSFDWPLAACAALHDGEAWRVVLGAVAPVPWRSLAAEAAAGAGAAMDAARAEHAGAEAIKGAAPMSRNAWRLPLVSAAVRRALLLADGKDPLA